MERRTLLAAILPVSLTAAWEGRWIVKLRGGGEESRTVERNPEKTAIIVIDMWDDHHCVSAARRVGEMAPEMNRALKAAREKGIFVIHAPSDCMEFYQDTPQRRRAREAPFTAAPVKFQWNRFNPERESPLEAKLERSGCSCDTPEPCNPSFKAWKREHPAIEIGAADAVSDQGQEVFNLLESRGTEQVVIMGVHTNVCVLGRPFGIRQMVYLGKNVTLCRDLTDSYHRDPGRHFEGLHRIVEHIEWNWCPTMTSESITGQPPFRFQGDREAW